MSNDGYQYIFKSQVSSELIEDLIHLALLSTTALHGEPAVQLEARYNIDVRSSSCVISAGTQVGIDLNRLFVCYAREQLGEGAFTVKPNRVTEASC